MNPSEYWNYTLKQLDNVRKSYNHQQELKQAAGRLLAFHTYKASGHAPNLKLQDLGKLPSEINETKETSTLDQALDYFQGFGVNVPKSK